jgi:hypothetical protein
MRKPRSRQASVLARHAPLFRLADPSARSRLGQLSRAARTRPMVGLHRSKSTAPHRPREIQRATCRYFLWQWLAHRYEIQRRYRAWPGRTPNMTKSQIRRLEKLERTGMCVWQTNLRAVARRLGMNEAKLLRMVEGHERQLGEASGPDGRITWEGFHLVYGLPDEGSTTPPQRSPATPGPRRRPERKGSCRSREHALGSAREAEWLGAYCRTRSAHGWACTAPHRRRESRSVIGRILLYPLAHRYEIQRKCRAWPGRPQICTRI